VQLLRLLQQRGGIWQAESIENAGERLRPSGALVHMRAYNVALALQVRWQVGDTLPKKNSSIKPPKKSRNPKR